MSHDEFPPHVTLTRSPYTEPKPAFTPPQAVRRRTVHVGSSGSTLTQTIYDDGPIEDVHFPPDSVARELQRAATDSILYGNFPDRETNSDLRQASAARAASARMAKGGNR
jgi:hypothetical protein